MATLFPFPSVFNRGEDGLGGVMMIPLDGDSIWFEEEVLRGILWAMRESPSSVSRERW